MRDNNNKIKFTCPMHRNPAVHDASKEFQITRMLSKLFTIDYVIMGYDFGNVNDV